MIEQGSVRNLEQIQEEDAGDKMPRAASLTIVALGGACIVFASLALGGRKPAAAAPPIDPLGELVAQHAHQGQSAPPAVKATDLSAQDVTFPSILSDDKAPTTALAAVRQLGADHAAVQPCRARRARRARPLAPACDGSPQCHERRPRAPVAPRAGGP